MLWPWESEVASIADICNLALSHLGDEATVASIDPPEGSAQADHCARWYPQALDEVLQEHTWSFATRRIALANLSFAYPMWQYAYAQPDDCLKFFAVLPPEANDDYSIGLPLPARVPFGDTVYPVVAYVPQAFETETDEDGNVIILTNQIQAVGRYVVRITDTTKFSPIFVQALSRLLASYLAGPIIKGAEGRAESAGQFQAYQAALARARSADAIQRQVRPQHAVPWMVGR